MRKIPEIKEHLFCISGILSGYHRLGSGSISPPPQTASLAPSHARTGSSPAMMQNISNIDSSAPSSSPSSTAPGGSTSTSSGNRAGRTNTYPKIPDRFRMRSPDSDSPAKPQNQQEEEVIFF